LRFDTISTDLASAIFLSVKLHNSTVHYVQKCVQYSVLNCLYSTVNFTDFTAQCSLLLIQYSVLYCLYSTVYLTACTVQCTRQLVRCSVLYCLYSLYKFPRQKASTITNTVAIIKLLVAFCSMYMEYALLRFGVHTPANYFIVYIHHDISSYLVDHNSSFSNS
jgi:hypothetical protein